MLGIFRQRHSILLEFDHFDFDAVEELKAQVEEVRNYYKLSKITELLTALDSRHPNGLACLVFKNARKSFFLHAAKWLVNEEIPFTLLLRPECIGLNRLPLREEMEQYVKFFPKAVTLDEINDVDAAGWEHPEVREVFLRDCRKRCGPLPLNEMDPTLFFGTWGQISDLPPKLRDFGVHIESDPKFPSVRSGLAFTSTQVKAPISFARVTRDCGEAPLKELGFRGAMDGSLGEVSKNVNPFQLPVWKMERQEDGG